MGRQPSSSPRRERERVSVNVNVNVNRNPKGGRPKAENPLVTYGCRIPPVDRDFLEANGGPVFLRAIIERARADRPVSAEIEVAEAERALETARARLDGARLAAVQAKSEDERRRDAAWKYLVEIRDGEGLPIGWRDEGQFHGWVSNDDPSSAGAKFLREFSYSVPGAVEIFRERRGSLLVDGRR